ERAGLHDRAGEQVDAGGLALLDDRERHVAETLGAVGMLREELSEADGRREAGGSAADDEEADVDALLRGRRRLRDRVGRVERRREVRRSHPPLRRASRSSAKRGSTSCTSPTTPRSASSKIGACLSLFTATI